VLNISFVSYTRLGAAKFSLKIFLTEVGFNPGSPSSEAGALSITPRAHAPKAPFKIVRSSLYKGEKEAFLVSVRGWL